MGAFTPEPTSVAPSPRVDYSRQYRQWHSDDAEHVAGMTAFCRAWLQGRMPESKESRILDVGCGMGFAILALRDMGYTHVQGVDIDPGQVGSCLAKGLPVECTSDTTAYLNSQGPVFDCILLLDVLEHVERNRQVDFVAALYRALKVGGRLIATVPNATSSMGCRWRYIDWTHCTSFTEASLRFLLDTGGFQVESINAVEFFGRPKLVWYLPPRCVQVWPWKNLLQWCALKVARGWRRLECIGELGWDQGVNVPLSLNLLGSAKKGETANGCR